MVKFTKCIRRKCSRETWLTNSSSISLYSRGIFSFPSLSHSPFLASFFSRTFTIHRGRHRRKREPRGRGGRENKKKRRRKKKKKKEKKRRKKKEKSQLLASLIAICLVLCVRCSGSMRGSNPKDERATAVSTRRGFRGSDIGLYDLKPRVMSRRSPATSESAQNRSKNSVLQHLCVFLLFFLSLFASAFYQMWFVTIVIIFLPFSPSRTSKWLSPRQQDETVIVGSKSLHRSHH